MKSLLYLLVLISIIHVSIAAESDLDFRESASLSLQDIGVNVGIDYKGELWNIAHGKTNKDMVYVDNFDLIFGFDLDKIIGLTGGNLSFHVLGNNGFEPNEYLGSIHGISNIAAPHAWKLFTVQYEQMLFENSLSILIGTYDYNSEFDAKPSAGLFINPSQGIGVDIAQSGDNGPSIFPTASLGMRIKATPYKNTYILAVVVDGVPGTPHQEVDSGILLRHHDGLLISSEAGIDESESQSGLKIGGGYWYYTAEYDELFAKVRNWGVYSFIDKALYKEEDQTQGLSGFFRLGIADNEANDTGYFTAGGLIYTGLIPGRDNDIAGISFATAVSSNYSILKEHIGHSDNVVELTYQLNLFESLFIQPNIQYFFCPESSHVLNNFVAIGIRIGVGIF